MSEENAADPQDYDPASTPESVPESAVNEEPSGRGKLRQIVLLCLLGLMLVALAYDYRVARPNVEKAFDQIAKLNNEMNASATATPTLNSHIHKEIGRAPTRMLLPKKTEPYRVEVFSWTAGLPFRTHDLYAIYVPNGNDLVFMRHYKFQLPKGEFDPPRRSATSDEGEDPEGAQGAGPPGDFMEGPEAPGGDEPGDEGLGEEGPRGPRGEGGPGRGGEGRPQRPRGEGDTPDADEGSPTPPESIDETPPGTPPAEATPDATPSTPEASPEPAEKPAAEQPPPESDAPPAASEAQEKPSEAKTEP